MSLRSTSNDAKKQQGSIPSRSGEAAWLRGYLRAKNAILKGIRASHYHPRSCLPLSALDSGDRMGPFWSELKLVMMR